MRYPIRVDTSIRGRMDDVVKAFRAEAFLSAISLALTIPDICGKRLYPHEKKPGSRYVKWFDEYVASNYPGSCVPGKESSGPYCFSGSDCYQLRCVYLHEGSNAPHPDNIDKGRTVYNVIQFRVGGCNHIGYLDEFPSGKVFRQVDLDLLQFIENLQDGVDAFLEDHPEMNDDDGSDSFLYCPISDFRDHDETC